MPFHFCGLKKQPENLRVRRRGPPRDEVQEQEYEKTSGETSEEVEGSRSETHGKEEELSLGSEDGERPRKRPLNRIDSSLIGHGRFKERAKT